MSALESVYKRVLDRVLNFAKYFTTKVTQLDLDVYDVSIGSHCIRLWLLNDDVFWHDPRFLAEKLCIDEGRGTSVIILCRIPSIVVYEVQTSFERAEKWYGFRYRVDVYGLSVYDTRVEASFEKILYTVTTKYILEVIRNNALLVQVHYGLPCPKCGNVIEHYYVSRTWRPSYVYECPVRDYYIVCNLCGTRMRGVEVLTLLMEKVRDIKVFELEKSSDRA